MVRRMVRSGGALLVLAVAVCVVGGVAPPAALAAASPGPGVDAAVDYTIPLNGEYPPQHPFGPYAGGDAWGEWDHIFTAEWHQGSWVVSYGGVTLSAYLSLIHI